MNETDTNAQSQKPKTSKLAIAALLIPVVMWGSGICIFEVCGSFSRNTVPQGAYAVLESFATFLTLTSGVVGIILGVLALILIKESKGMLKGKRFAIEGMIVAVALECVFFVFLFATVAIGGR